MDQFLTLSIVLLLVNTFRTSLLHLKKICVQILPVPEKYTETLWLSEKYCSIRYICKCWSDKKSRVSLLNYI